MTEYTDRLNKIYTYTRVGDGKVFKIKFYGHWTDIVSEDGETDSVKWLGGTGATGGEAYTSASKGFKYERTRND